MDRRTVLTKTAKGLMEVTGKTSLLPRDQRTVLSHVDGKATVGDLRQRIEKLSESKLGEVLARLVREGFVREFVTAPTSVSPPSQVPIVEESGDLDFSDVLQANAARAAAQGAEADRVTREVAAAREREQAALAARATREAQEKQRPEAEARDRREAEAKAKREAEEKARREAEERARREGEEKAKRAAAEKAKREAEERAKHEAEERTHRAAEEKAKRAAEEQAKRQAEERARRAAEEKARREAEEKAKREAEEKAKRAAEERARRDAEAKARREAEEARREAEARARREAEEKARQEAEAQERREREEAERRESEARIRRELEEAIRRAADQSRIKAEAAAAKRREAEFAAQREAEERAKREAEERARREAAAKAQREAEEQARREAAAKAQREAQEQARREAEDKARREAEARARAEAEALARREAEERAAREAAIRAEREAEERARREAAERLRREQEEQARLDAQAQAERDAAARAARAAEERAQREADERAAHEAEELATREAAERARRDAEESTARDLAAGAIGEPEPQVERDAGAQRAEELRARKETERKARDEERHRAKAEAEAAARARKEERAREKASQDERHSQPSEPSDPPPPVRRRKTANLPRMIGLATAAATAVGFAVLQFLPLDAGFYEKLGSDAFAAPVKIRAASFALLPTPVVKLEDVSIGGEQVRIASVRATPDLASMFGDRRAFNAVELSGVEASPAGVTGVLWQTPKTDRLSIRQMVGHGVKVALPGMELPPLDVTAQIGSDGAVQKLQLASSDRKITATIVPGAGAAALDVAAAKLQVPFGSSLELADFAARGQIKPGEVALSEFDARLWDGILRGRGTLRFGDAWSFEGEVDLKQAEAAQVAPGVLSSGRVLGRAVFAMQSPEPARLFDVARLEGTFTVEKGQLAQIDLARLMQAGSSSSTSTLFNDLSGQGAMEAGKLALRNLKLGAGLLSATGSVDVEGGKQISGKVAAEMRTPTGASTRSAFTVSGTLPKVVLKR